MRIAYGVMGYGRGHAMRTMSVLPALSRDHEITVFAGGDAYEVLAPRFDTVRIPTIGYHYGGGGTHSLPITLARNVAPVADLLFGGRGTDQLTEAMRSRGIEMVISDSEAWTHRVAQRLALPRISFDHVGIIAYCKPHFPPDLWALGMRDGWGYRQLMGIPDRILISSFYRAEPAYPQVHVVGPMLRDEVREAQAVDGDYLLAYFNKGEHQYLPHIDRALRLLDCKVRIYGTAHRGEDDNLEFRAPSVQGFIDDFAGCRAVLSTAGNQLIGEALHFGKPILALPEPAFEQRLNAYMIEQMGVGQRGELLQLTPSDVDRFLGNRDRFRRSIAWHAAQPGAGDGRSQAIDWLQDNIASARRPPRQARKRAASRRPRLDGATAST